MPREEFVRARTEAHIKQQAELVLNRLGLTMSEAINLFLVQLTMHEGLPFPVQVAEGDASYAQMKATLEEEWKEKLNQALEEGESDIKAGRVYTMEEAKAQTSQAIQRIIEIKKQQQ
jgi:DNA-damage-inducible protein J